MTDVARPPRVARMLLRSVLTSLVCAMPFWMSACVLPIAPAFQDPAASVNYAPEILLPDPMLGSIVSGTPMKAPTFHVTVSDPNVGDTLYVRFLADYPPNTANTRNLTPPERTFAPTADGTRIVGDVDVTPSCSVFNLANIPIHQIMVVVADSPFLDALPEPGQPVDLTKLKDPSGLEVFGSWTLEMECP
jgi:hypothetical protein